MPSGPPCYLKRFVPSASWLEFAKTPAHFSVPLSQLRSFYPVSVQLGSSRNLTFVHWGQAGSGLQTAVRPGGREFAAGLGGLRRLRSAARAFRLPGVREIRIPEPGATQPTIARNTRKSTR